MQHKPMLLFYLNEKIEPAFTQALKDFSMFFRLIHFSKNNKLDQKLNDNPYFIVIGDKSNIERFVKRIGKSNLKNFAERFCIIVFGNDGFDLISSEKVNKFHPIINVLNYPLNFEQIVLNLLNSRKYLLNKKNTEQLQQKLQIQTKELRELNDIGVALSAEHDPDVLLKMILDRSQEITKADAGSLYLVEKKDGVNEDENNYFADKQLRFKLAQCNSISIDFTESVMPIEKHSIAGHVALTGQDINIADVYQLPKNSKFRHNRSFDESVGYRTKSMLVMPMKNHKNEIIGVLQLINRKKNWETRLTTEQEIENEIIEFDEKCVDLASSLASQAAVSIENTRLYEEIKKLFEGFIKASVHAIEQRDPTTFGHSERVATLTTALAEKIDQLNSGKYKNVKFSRDDIQQINYAALLHDFGKIGVREDILVKAKKLFPYELEAVKTRFRIFCQATELNFSKEKISYLFEAERKNSLKQLELLDEKTAQKIQELDEYLKFIININEPTIMKQAGFEMLAQIGKIIFEDNGKSESLLNDREMERLSIPKGSLSNEERLEIESHVNYTFNFLNRIPWTKELKQVPQIAYAHHEKIDGSGYPRGLSKKEIPIQSRMMTIADIYDALTAWDRPYKKAVPVEKALNILQWEVDEGKVDADLFEIFLEAKLFELVGKPDDV